MNVEETLVDELLVVASATDVPPPPAVPDLVRTADHDRRRSLTFRIGGTALVAAAVVGAVVLGTRIGGPDAAPSPAKPSPSYYAPGVPYLYKQRLYVDHEEQPGSWFEVHSAGRFTVALGIDESAVILRDGDPVETVEPRVYVVRLSRDGTKAAWISATEPDAGLLVVRDLVRSRDLGRLPLVLKHEKDGGLGYSLLVKNDGEAFYDINDVHWKWTPGGTPTHTEQQPNDWSSYGTSSDFDVDTSVRLSPDHLWGAWLTDRHGQVVHASGDADPVQGAVTVQKPNDPGSRFTIALPDGADGGFVSWDSPTTVLVQVPDAPGGEDVLACDITTRKCVIPKHDMSP